MCGASAVSGEVVCQKPNTPQLSCRLRYAFTHVCIQSHNAGLLTSVLALKISVRGSGKSLPRQQLASRALRTVTTLAGAPYRQRTVQTLRPAARKMLSGPTVAPPPGALRASGGLTMPLSGGNSFGVSALGVISSAVAPRAAFYGGNTSPAPPPRVVAPVVPPVPDEVLAAGAAAGAQAGLRLVCWDFDCTLLSLHSYAERIAPADVEGRDIASDFVDLSFFRRVLAALGVAGVDVAVASFGLQDVISAYLARAAPGGPEGSPPPPFSRSNVLTPAHVGVPDGCSLRGGKNILLHRLCVLMRVQPRQILFFDDDRLNVEFARADGFAAVHTPNGFYTTAWMDGLTAYLAGRQTPLSDEPVNISEASRQATHPGAAVVAAVATTAGAGTSSAPVAPTLLPMTLTVDTALPAPGLHAPSTLAANLISPRAGGSANFGHMTQAASQPVPMLSTQSQARFPDDVTLPAVPTLEPLPAIAALSAHATTSFPPPPL